MITRDTAVELEKTELAWMTEMFTSHGVKIVKLTGRFLSRLLSKLRNPQKHDEGEQRLTSLLDDYDRVYISGRTPSRRVKKRASAGSVDSVTQRRRV